jgi:hypothetical protein
MASAAHALHFEEAKVLRVAAALEASGIASAPVPIP